MKVIIDLVVNHTSDRDLWFQEARADPEASHRDLDARSESEGLVLSSLLRFPAGTEHGSLVKTAAPGMLGLRYEWKGNALFVLHNFSAKPKEVRFRLADKKGDILTNLRKNDESHTGGRRPTSHCA